MQRSVLIIGILILVAIIGYAVFENQSQKKVKTQQTDIKWYTDLNAALDEAKNTNKPVFIDFYATWCSYCNKMDENTFSDLQVQQKLNNYITVKIDIDRNPTIASNYKVYGVPTQVILNSNGDEVKRNEGYLGPNELLNQL